MSIAGVLENEFSHPCRTGQQPSTGTCSYKVQIGSKTHSRGPIETRDCVEVDPNERQEAGVGFAKSVFLAAGFSIHDLVDGHELHGLGIRIGAEAEWTRLRWRRLRTGW